VLFVHITANFKEYGIQWVGLMGICDVICLPPCLRNNWGKKRGKSTPLLLLCHDIPGPPIEMCLLLSKSGVKWGEKETGAPLMGAWFCLVFSQRALLSGLLAGDSIVSAHGTPASGERNSYLRKYLGNLVHINCGGGVWTTPFLRKVFRPLDLFQILLHYSLWFFF
jgi:hypothetical protein